MKRTVVNLVVDLAAATLFIGMIATGIVLRFPLPPGTNKILSLWGLTRHQWGEIHSWISLGLLGALLVHVILHWPWIVSVIGRHLHVAMATPGHCVRSGAATLLILGVVLGLFVWAAYRSVQPIAESARVGVCPPEDRPADRGRQGARAAVDFWRDVQPIFERSCRSCHGVNGARGNFRVDRREDFFIGATPWIVAGDSASSRLIALVSGAEKAVALPERHTLTEKEVGLLRSWIDAGADWPERPAPPRR